jgi:hypothetical protein
MRVKAKALSIYFRQIAGFWGRGYAAAMAYRQTNSTILLPRIAASLARTAAILWMLLAVAAPAQAYTISKEVGPLLKEVQALIAAKNYKAATAKLDEAEAVKVYADDGTVINEFRQVIKVKSASQP